MRTLFETWKGKNIYHDSLSGLFYTDSGYSSYVLSSARHAAINGFWKDVEQHANK
jgi:hypothetical protein